MSQSVTYVFSDYCTASASTGLLELFPFNSRLQPEKVNKGGGQPWQNESQLVFEVGREGEQARGETDDQINGD